MNDDINYKNSPLHGLSLKNMLIELVDHYGFEILFAYLNINCFNTKPSIESSVKFLKKTDWAREKVEAFYLYQFKSLPRASAEQFKLPPRDRIIPEHHIPGEPAELSLEDAARLREKREQKASGWDQRSNSNSGSGRGYSSDRKQNSTSKYSSDRSSRAPKANTENSNPWANWENRHKGKD